MNDPWAIGGFVVYGLFIVIPTILHYRNTLRIKGP